MNKRVLALLCAVFMTLAATVGMLPFSVSAADKSELTEQRLVMTPDGGVVRPSAPVRTRGAKSSTPVRSEKGAAPAQVVLEGALPADVSAETVNVDPMNYILPTANDILCAYDISLYSAEQEYEPENTEIRVSVSGSMIADAADGSLVVVHIQDDPAAPMELIEDFTLSGDTLTFSTDHFSVFLIVDVDEEGTETIRQARECYFYLSPGTDNHDGTYTASLYPIATDEQGDPGRTPVWKQIVKAGDCLNEVPVPPADASGKSFLGWYYVEAVGDVPDPETADGSVTVTYRWQDDAARAEFGKPIETIHVDEEHPERMTCYFLAPLYQNYRVLVFHDYRAPGSDEDTVLTRKLVVLGGDSGAMQADAKISDVPGSVVGDNMLFTGWDDTPDNHTAAADHPVFDANGVMIDTYLHITETAYPDREIHLYPHYDEAHWLMFDKVKSKASYTSPILVRAGQKVDNNMLRATKPTLEGFEFEGWYADKSYSNESRVTDNNCILQGSWSANGGFYLTESMTLYAKWRSVSSATYKIIYWVQRADAANHPDTPNEEKTYDYYSYTEMTGYPGNNTATPAYAPPSHFHFGWTDGPKIIDEDGNTVVNVYYDRDVRTIVFNFYGAHDSDSFSSNNNESETPQKYGLIDGEYVPLTRVVNVLYTIPYTYSQVTAGQGSFWSSQSTYYYLDDNNQYKPIQLYERNGVFYQDRNFLGGFEDPFTAPVFKQTTVNISYTGTRYVLNGNTYVESNSDAGTQYYLDSNGGYIPLIDTPEYKWYDPDNNEYTGIRYIKVQVTGWYAMHTFKGLYGQTFADAGYEWPSGQIWYESRSGNSPSGTMMSFVTEFSDPEITNYYGNNNVQSTNRTIYHYLEPATKTYTDNDWILAHTWTGSNVGSYTLTSSGKPNNKYQNQGFVLSAYKTSENGSWTPYTNQTSVSFTSSNKIWIRYTRAKSTFNFMNEDGVTVKKSVQIPVGAKISDYASPDEPYTYSDPDKEFDKWCIDAAGVNKFDFDTAMPYVPEGSYNVYPGYVVPEYQVIIYPNGGAFSNDSYSTYFNLTPSEHIKEYTALNKQFKPDPAGDYYYIYVSPYSEVPLTDPDDPDVKLNRVAKYVEIDSDEARAYRNFIDTSQRYSPLEPQDGSYVLEGWYQLTEDELIALASGDETVFDGKELYNFGENIKEPTILAAKWENVGARYRFIYTPVDENGVGGTLPDGNYDPPVPSGISQDNLEEYYIKTGYLEGNSVLLAGAPVSITAGYVFEYWKIGDEKYGAGDTVTIRSGMGDRNLNIEVKAVFARSEESIHNQKLTNLWLHMNDGADPEYIKKLNFLQENELVKLSDYTELFQRESFELLGWATEPDAAVPEFSTLDRVGADLREPTDTDGKTNHLYAVWLPHPAPTMYHDNAVPFGVLVISAGAAVVLIILVRRRKEVVVRDDASL